jgi:hypothetical protein
MTQTGGPRVFGICPTSQTKALPDEETVRDTICAFVSDEFELLLRIGEVEEGQLGGEPVRARGDILAVI